MLNERFDHVRGRLLTGFGERHRRKADAKPGCSFKGLLDLYHPASLKNGEQNDKNIKSIMAVRAMA